MIRTTTILLALTLGLGSDALAQRRRGDDTPQKKRPIPEQLKQFDKNGDGTLDEAERKAVREWIDAHRKKGGEEAQGRRRRGGEGTPPRPERGQRGGDARARILKQFDTNGDGKLDESERAAAEKARNERGTPPAKGGQRGRGTPPAGRGRRGDEGTPPPRGRRGNGDTPPERGGRGGEGTPPQRRGRGTGELPERLKRFDKNGDGKLDAAEREAARDEVSGRRGRRGGTPPAPRPGTRRAAFGARPPRQGQKVSRRPSLIPIPLPSAACGSRKRYWNQWVSPTQLGSIGTVM